MAFARSTPGAKATVEKHVSDLLNRAKSDHERKSMGLVIARQYMKVNDYSKARQHLAQYLSVEGTNKEAHRLLGSILAWEREYESALTSFKRYYEFGGDDKELLLRACEICALCSDSTVKTYGDFWSTKAEKVHGTKPQVFSLKERMTSVGDHSAGKVEVEKLIRTELGGHPLDEQLWIKLLDHLVANKKVVEAYAEAFKLEHRRIPFPLSFKWHSILKRVCEACQEKSPESDFGTDYTFHFNYLWTLDSLLFLSIGRETIDKSSGHTDETASDVQSLIAVYNSALFKAYKVMNEAKMKPRWFEESLVMFASSLLCNMGAMLIKMVTQGHFQWSEAFPMCAHLFWSSYSVPVNGVSPAFMKEIHAPRALENAVKTLLGVRAHFRASQAGHALVNLKKLENGEEERLHKGYHRFASVTARVKILQALVGKRANENASYLTSNFNTLSEFASKPGGALLIPNFRLLVNDDRACLSMTAASLHILTWISLQSETGKLTSYETVPDARFLKHGFLKLPYGRPLSMTATADALSLLDLEAFLCATAYCASRRFDSEDKKLYPVLQFGAGKINMFTAGAWFAPAAACDSLCNHEQDKFWSTANDLVNSEEFTTGSSVNADASSPFRIVQRGLAAIRLEGHRGNKLTGSAMLSLPIVIHLARHFGAKTALMRLASQENRDEEELAFDGTISSGISQINEPLTKQELNFLEARASLYWGETVRMIEMSAGSALTTPDSLFGIGNSSGPVLFPDLRNPKTDEMTAALEDGRFYLAKQMMRDGKREEALRAFSALQSPKATFAQAKIYEMFANEASTAEEESGLLMKARAAINQTYDRLNSQCGVDGLSMPTKVFKELNEVLNIALSRIQSRISTLESYAGKEALNISNGHDSVLAGISNLQLGTPRVRDSRISASSTPFATPKCLFNASVTSNFEVRPSPERLDAQIKSIMATQEQLTAATNERNAELADVFKDLKREVKGMKIAVEALVPAMERQRESHEKSLEEIVKLHATKLENFGQRQIRMMEDIQDSFQSHARKLEDFSHKHIRMIEEISDVMKHLNSHVRDLKDVLTDLKATQQQQLMLNPLGALYNPAAIASFCQNQLASEFLFGMRQPGAPVLPTAVGGMHPSFPPVTLASPLNVHPPAVVPSAPAPTLHFTQPSAPAPRPADFSLTRIPTSVTSGPCPVSTSGLLSGIPAPLFSAVTPKHAESAVRITPSRISATVVNEENDSASEHGEEHDPMPDFKPIVPLPEKVELCTGEEGWEALFEERSKLLRYVNGEWKERGVGVMKILQDSKDNRRRRIVMRREPIMKVCCNHVIAADMKFDVFPKKSDYITWAARDFSEDDVPEGVDEKFTAKFKTKEIAERFLTVAAESVAKLGSKPVDNSFKIGGLTFTSKPKVIETPEVARSPEKVDEPPKTAANVFSGFSFLGTVSKSTFANLSKDTSVTTTVSPSTFGSSLGSAPTFGSLATKTPLFGSADANLPTFASLATKSPFGGSVSSSKDFPGAGLPVFGGFSTEKESRSPSKGDGEPEEYEPDVTFKPVVPLPPLVEVKTGEENEEEIFKERAKLLRFDSTTKEWKERGLGDIKILKNKETGRKRVLMRREQVLKICANFAIGVDMNVEFHNNSDKQLYVLVPADLSEPDEGPKSESFIIRFKLPERAQEFRRLFNEKSSNKAVEKAVEQKGALSTLLQFKPKAGSWSCQSCYVVNDEKVVKCVACEAVRAESESQAPREEPKALATEAGPKQDSLSSMDKFKPKPGSWECDGCLVRNNENVNVCVACEQPRPGFEPPKKETEANVFSFGTKSGSGGGGGFTFGTTPAKTDTVFNPPKTGFAFGSASENPSFSFSFEPNKTYFTIGSSKKAEVVKGSEGDDSALKPQDTMTSATSWSSLCEEKRMDVRAVETLNKGEGFSFDLNTPIKGTPEKKAGEGTPSTSFQFTLPTSNRARRTSSGEKNIASPRKSSGGEDGDAYVSEDEGEGIYFKPVIPLPPLVEVTSGEEDEEVLYVHRAKLYRFSAADKEWKERGLGDVKVLKNRSTSHCRILMRREQVLKLCLNHYLTPDITFSAFASNDVRSWTWLAKDFSEDEPEVHKFALRFKNKEIAEEFLDSVKKAQEIMKTACEKRETLPAGEEKTQKSGTDDEVTVVFEKKLPENLIQRAVRLKLPSNFFDYENKTPCPGCRGCDDDWDWRTGTSSERKGPVLKTDAGFGDQTKKQDAAPLFGAVSTELQSASAPVFGGFSAAVKPPVHGEPVFGKLGAFGSDTITTPSVATVSSAFGGFGSFGGVGGMTFSDLAKQSGGFGTAFGGSKEPAEGGGEFSSFTSFSGKGFFPGAGEVMRGFSNGQPTGDEGSEGDNYDPHYEPIVPLPPVVQLKTGEEDEENIYSHRAKLYRYATESKEWKERGVGDVKILKHPTTGKFRVLMRREVVLKIACNFFLLPDMCLEKMSNSANSWAFSAMDYDEDEGYKEEKFALRFKTQEIADEFKDVWDKCREEAKNLDNSVNASATEEDEENDEVEEECIRVLETRVLLADPPKSQPKDQGECTVTFMFDEEYGCRVLIKRLADKEIIADLVISQDTEYETTDEDFTWVGGNYAIDESGEHVTEIILKLGKKSEVDQVAQLFDDYKTMALDGEFEDDDEDDEDDEDDNAAE